MVYSLISVVMDVKMCLFGSFRMPWQHVVSVAGMSERSEPNDPAGTRLGSDNHDHNVGTSKVLAALLVKIVADGQ